LSSLFYPLRSHQQGQFKTLAACFYLLLAVFLLLSVASPSHALSVRERSFDDLITRADEIIYGKVRHIHSEPSVNRIFTYIRLTEIITVKGQVDESGGEEYLLRMAGGRHGNRLETYPGVPKFEVGQRYIIFVRNNNKTLFPLVGLKQGIFSTRYNALSQKHEVLSEKQTTSIQRSVSALRSRLNITAPRGLEGRISVDSFLDIIRERKENAK